MPEPGDFQFTPPIRDEDVVNKDGFFVTVEDVSPLLKDSDITFTDVTTGNVSTTKHGYAPKAPGSATVFLDWTANYTAVDDADLTTTDVTTNDVTISKHGFTPKAPNDTTKFLRGDATWAVPALTYKNGITSRASTTASGDQTIAHGLGITPKRVMIYGMYMIDGYTQGNNFASWSIGAWDSSSTGEVYGVKSINSVGGAASDTAAVITLQDDVGSQFATIATNSTNIVLTWTKSGSPRTATMYLLWVAEG
jgi:hypothetical protein